MKKRSTLWIVATILIGGLIMLFSFNHHTEQEKLQAQMQREQKRMALYAVNYYEGVEKIEFVSFEENKMTGVWSSYAKINNRFEVIFQLWGFDGEIGVLKGRDPETGEYLILKNNKTQEVTIDNIEIIYWKG